MPLFPKGEKGEFSRGLRYKLCLVVTLECTVNSARRTLTLIRHAKSSWDQPLPDFDRPLNKRGRKNAPELGEWLAAQDITFDQILTSPAQRALETTELVAKALNIPDTAITADKSIYLASLSTLFDLVRALDDQHPRVALVGHNPGISYLADHLVTAGPATDMRTCACIQIRFPVTRWAEVGAHQGEQLFYHDPKSSVGRSFTA